MAKAGGHGEALAGVGQLREKRLRAKPDLTMGKEMDWALRDLTRQRRSVAGCAKAWNQVVPPDLAERSTLDGVVKGVLTVRVPDAACNFALQRFLRGGGERALISAASVPISKVRVLVG